MSLKYNAKASLQTGRRTTPPRSSATKRFGRALVRFWRETRMRYVRASQASACFEVAYSFDGAQLLTLLKKVSSCFSLHYLLFA